MFPRVVLLLIVATGCVEVHGGAVELAWQIFDEAGNACTSCCPDLDPCEAAGAKSVRLHLVSCTGASGDPCSQTDGGVQYDHCFSCSDRQKATRFDIPAGHYVLTVDAVAQTASCDRSTPIAASGPGPIERDVLRGEIVQLGAVALTVPACQCTPSQCPSPTP